METDNSHGGKREGAGRKPKANEKQLIEKLDNIINQDEAIELLNKMAKKDFRALQLYLSYRWGKPKERLDVTTNEESLNIPVIKFAND